MEDLWGYVRHGYVAGLQMDFPKSMTYIGNNSAWILMCEALPPTLKDIYIVSSAVSCWRSALTVLCTQGVVAAHSSTDADVMVNNTFWNDFVERSQWGETPLTAPFGPRAHTVI